MAERHSLPMTRRRKVLLGSTLAVWGGVLVVVCATLLAGHFYALPIPSVADPVLAAGVHSDLATEGWDGWAVVHVFYAECGCSERVAEHLFAEARPPGVHEKVVVVGEHPQWQAKAERNGFSYETVTQEDLRSRYGIEGAPLMVVVDAGGQIRYAGAYTDRKRGLVVRDLEILEDLRAGNEVAAIPLFGCAVGKDLQAAFDPLRLKY